jgi:hypothetical protein
MKLRFSFTRISAISLMLVCSPLQASININVDAVQKSVVFLYAADVTGAVDKNKPVGTGFLIAVPLKSDRSRSYTVLVTARHIFDPGWAGCPVANPNMIYARVNKKSKTANANSSGVEFIPLPLVSQGKQNWFHHSDNEVDAAISPIAIDTELVDVVSIPVEFFPTDEEISRQSIGDPVLSAGLLPNLPGNARNYPIFKFGQISNIPTESIATNCGPMRPSFLVKVWLIAANLVSGNSGSPIFHVPLGGSGVVLGGTRPMLLGVQSMSFGGADVAGMTPIKFVYEMLEAQNLNDADLRRGPLPQTANDPKN